MPTCRTIPGNRVSQTVHHAIWFDTETDPFALDDSTTGHRLREGWAAYARRSAREAWHRPVWHSYRTPTEFWDWVENHTRNKTTIYMFCHNTSFDLQVLHTFKQLPEWGWHFTRLCIEAPPTIIHARKGNKRLVLLDTLNWWRQPLWQIGKMVGLPKLDMPAPDAPKAVWDTYCKRDVEIIMVAVQRWCDWLTDNDMGGFAPTLASQAMRTWRHKYMHTHVYVHQDTRADEIARACYHGGRVECYYIGKGRETVYVLDVNSMYPYVMQQHVYPTKLVDCTTLPNAVRFGRALDKYAVCARVSVSTDEPMVPVLYKGKLTYPVGQFTADLCTPELQALEQSHAIVRVHRYAAYECADLFGRFVTEMYGRRLDHMSRGDGVTAHMYKIMLNSLYGKFGQRGIRWEDVGTLDTLDAQIWDEMDVATGTLTRMRAIGGIVQEHMTEPESSYSMPAIAAHVTAYARMYLWELQCKAGRENVMYSDTDCLWVNAAGYARLQSQIHQTQLGCLKLEGTHDDWEIHGAKDYRLGDLVKIKGVPLKAIPLGSGRFDCDRWSSLVGGVRAGNVALPTTTRYIKHLRRDYQKGCVLPDGTVRPLTFTVFDESGAVETTD